MKRNESQENYLERIYFLKKRKGFVRSVDIARALQVTKPSVSVAMKQLREGGLITMDEHNLIDLTAEGLVIAKRMAERHEHIAQLLMRLGVEEEVAYDDACRVEHDISEQTFEALKKLSKEGLGPQA
ncbi:MAG: metal-dependent transcriptional regulator [Clostridiales bacterium]|jgi:Mn-dependent DtxR family transcriptional regulator|nr:metal-dependent transcriptional regulator [Clostridiales bacterium]